MGNFGWKKEEIQKYLSMEFGHLSVDFILVKTILALPSIVEN